MGMKAPKASSIPTAPQGIFPARLARVIEIGEHDGKFGVKDQVVFFYNLVTKTIDDPDGDLHGKQFQVRSKPMKNSTSKKAALWDHRKVLNPKTTSYEALLGLPAFVTTEHNAVENDGETTVYCNIINVSGVPDGIEVGPLDIETYYFNFDEPDPDIWENKLWDRMREQIMSAENYQGSAVERMVLRLAAMNPETVQGESE